MTAPPLGRLISVPVREVWAHESKDFTPWLAEAENLSLLTETLGVGPLQLQGVEVPVGNFYLDILARDVEGAIIVIENQFGPTNHEHLGQILTYVAGQDGPATVIWIAETFREEHRAAIDWLNASTIAGFNFFAVEVEALRIDESVAAPWFNVVAKPNDWSRNIAQATRSAANDAMDDRAKAYATYWSGFATFLEDKGTPYRPNIAQPERQVGRGRVGLDHSRRPSGSTAGCRWAPHGVDWVDNPEFWEIVEANDGSRRS
jgi:hypothetical protein